MKKNETIKKVAVAAPQLHSLKVTLKIGSWKKYFDSIYLNNIIALALNDFDNKIFFDINGYLITNQNLYLVVETTEKSIEEMVNKIEAQIIHLLKKNPQKPIANSSEISFITDDENVSYALRKPLFKIYPLENEHLIKLITGREVTLPYYSRDLESLKSMIHNNPFCSAIFYLGGLSPVKITPFKEPKDTKEEEIIKF